MITEVADTRRHVERAYAGHEWRPAHGRDGVSRVFIAGDQVVKLRPVSVFDAGMLSLALRDVHGALAPLGLAPPLRLVCYDGTTLATACDLVVEPVPGARPTPEDIGAALAAAHAALAGVRTRSGEPWVGFYGEHHEFAMITPAVADDELRQLGSQLLPHARRAAVPGPTHYVHRDLHPGNALLGTHGPCLIDWELTHAGSALDDLAMTACLWAAETSAPPVDTVTKVLRGYAERSGTVHELSAPATRAALALAGLRQGVGAWFTDCGVCDAPYWPFVRRRMRVAAAVVCAT